MVPVEMVRVGDTGGGEDGGENGMKRVGPQWGWGWGDRRCNNGGNRLTA
jgi:hypothetical protein